MRKSPPRDWGLRMGQAALPCPVTSSRSLWRQGMERHPSFWPEAGSGTLGKPPDPPAQEQGGVTGTEGAVTTDPKAPSHSSDCAGEWGHLSTNTLPFSLYPPPLVFRQEHTRYINYTGT